MVVVRSAFPWRKRGPNFAVLTAYDKWQDMEDFGYPDLFRKIHPDKPIADVGRRTTEARDMVRVEIWDLIDQVR